jgi:uncharacterized protein involved in exopolysaccharide biosynthesis
MTIRDLLVFLFKWKTSLLLVFVLCMASATFFVFASPPSYTAHARVLVERNRSPIFRQVPSQGMDLAEALNTETAILLSRTVMERVVDELKPHERPRKPSAIGDALLSIRSGMEEAGLIYAETPRERWISLLQRQVKVRPALDASVLNVTFGDEDPQWAARIINAVIQEFIKHHVQVFSVKGSAELLKGRMQSLEAEYHKRRDELIALKKRPALTAPDDTRRELVRQSGTTAEQLIVQQAELDAALRRFEPGHPEVVLVQSRITRLQTSAAELRLRLQRIESELNEVDTLQRQVTELESQYRDFARRYDEAHLADQSVATSINVAAVDQAAVPDRPPQSRLLLLLVAAAASFALSFLIAFIREYFDRRLADPASAEALLGVPDLGSVARLPRRVLAPLSPHNRAGGP